MDENNTFLTEMKTRKYLFHGDRNPLFSLNQRPSGSGPVVQKGQTWPPAVPEAACSLLSRLTGNVRARGLEEPDPARPCGVLSPGFCRGGQPVLSPAESGLELPELGVEGGPCSPPCSIAPSPHRLLLSRVSRVLFSAVFLSWLAPCPRGGCPGLRCPRLFRLSALSRTCWTTSLLVWIAGGGSGLRNPLRVHSRPAPKDRSRVFGSQAASW